MSSPIHEKGYTKLPNELFEAIINAKFNGTQYAIILAIIRATQGFHIESKTLGVAFFEKTTRRNKRQIAIELDKLIKRNIVTVVAGHTYGRSRELKINSDSDAWLPYEGV